MKLYYRGLSFDYNPSQFKRNSSKQIRRSEQPYELIYRGLTYHVDLNAEPAKDIKTPTTYKLSYRGITYWVNRNEQGEVTNITPSTCSSKKALMNSRFSTQHGAEEY